MRKIPDVTFNAKWRMDRFQYQTLKMKSNLIGLKKEIESLQSQISGLTSSSKQASRALSGIFSPELIARSMTMRAGWELMSKGIDGVSMSTIKLIGNLNKLQSSTKKSTSAFGGMFSPTWIARGMAMRVGWRLMYQVIDTVSKATTDLVMNNVKLEASLISLEHIAGTTGRRFGEVMSVVNNQIGEFATRGAVTSATMRLMQTSLSTDQIDKLIERFKEGAEAFGYVADEQLPLLARGFIEHRKVILNNIGYQKNLNQLWKETADELGTTANALNEAQRQQALYNSIMEETVTVQGLLEKKLDTAEGQLRSMSAEWKKLSEAVKSADLVKGFAEFTSEMLENARITLEFEQAIKHNAIYQKRWKEEVDDSLKTFRELGMTLDEQNVALEKMKKAFVEEIKELENAKTPLEELVDANIEMNAELNILKSNLSITAREIAKFTITIDENKESIEDNQHTIELERHELELLQRSLKALNSELTEQTKLQNEVKRALEESQSKLLRKQKVLDPEAFKETEDKLKDIQSALKRAVTEEERAQKLLLKRVEPKLWKEYQERASEAHAEVIKLTKEETNTKSTLETEIESLLETVKNQQLEYDTLTSKVNSLTQSESRLNDEIAIGQDRINGLNDQIFNWKKENYEAEESIVKLEEQMIELNTKIENGTTLLKDYYTNLYNLDEFQIRNKSYTVTEYQKVVRYYEDWGSMQSFGSPQGWRQAGGSVQKTGMYKLEQGEKVLTQMDQRKTDNSVDNRSVNVTIMAGDRSMSQVFDEVERLSNFKMKTMVSG